MRWLILFFALSPGTASLAQQGYNVELLDHWTGGQDDPYDLRFFDVAVASRYNGDFVFTVDAKRLFFFRAGQGALVPLGSTVLGDTLAFQDFRDVKVYGEYVLVSGSSGGIRVLDMQYLPDSLPEVHATTDPLLQSVHNMTVDHQKAILYASCYATAQLHVLDLTMPDSIQLLRSYAMTPHDCTVDGDDLFVYDIYDGFKVFNASDPLNLVLTGHMEFYQERGATHSGAVLMRDSVHILIDENPGYGIKVVDVSNPANSLLKTIHHVDSQDEDATPHNVEVRGDLVFVSHYTAGLQVLRWNGSALVPYGYYQTFLGSPGESFFLNGAWGVGLLSEDRVVVSDRGAGLFLFHVPDSGAEGEVESGVVFPSPTHTGDFTIALPPDFILPYEVEVLDRSGRTVVRQEENGQNWFQVNAHLAAGLYVVKVTDSEGKEWLGRAVVSY